MMSDEFVRDLDALAETAAFCVGTLLPLLVAVAAFWFSRRWRLIWRAALLIGASVVSGPVAFILLLELARLTSPTGRPGPAAGIITVPMAYVWALTIIASTLLLIGLAIFKGRASRSSP